MKRESRNRRKFSFIHSISVLNSIRRGPIKHQRAGFVQNLARKSCKMDMVFHNTFGLGRHSLNHHNQLCVEKIASGKRKSSSNCSVDKHERYATVDGDNAEVQISAEVCNDKTNKHEKKTIEGSETRAENSVE